MSRVRRSSPRSRSEAASALDRFIVYLGRGLAQGSIYALLALGFVLVFKATQTVNFAQGAIALVGTWTFSMVLVDWRFPGRYLGDNDYVVWFSALVFALVLAVLLGLIIERLIIRPMIGEPLFSIAVITLGLEAVLRTIGTDAVSINNRSLGIPWGSRRLRDRRGDRSRGRGSPRSSPRRWRSSASTCSSARGPASPCAPSPSTRRRRWPRASRSGGCSPSPGVRPPRSPSLGAICASMSPIGLGTVTAASAALAFRALPAVILGGLDSVAGALVGGLVVGLAEVFAGAYLAEHTDTLGAGFQLIVPYVVMLHRPARPPVRPVRHTGDPAGLMCGRPNLYTSYRAEASIFPTWTQRILMALFGVVMVLLPFSLPIINQLPFVRFLGDADWIRLTTQAVIFAVAALGLNLLTGVAGQVSLGHAFFMGAGAYAAVYLGGEPGSGMWGHELPIWIWLPGAGITAALIGIIIAPAAVRVRGLYLGIVTVGLVFIGIHLSRIFPEISGQPEVGRNFPPLEFKWWKEEEPVISFADDGHWLWFDVTGNQKTYLFCLALLGVAVLVAKNLVRTPHRPGVAGDPRPRRRRRDDGRPRGQVQGHRVRHLVVLRRRRRRRVRLVRRPAATGVLGPRPVRRVHRHPPHRRRRHDRRHAARHVLRRAAAAVHRGVRRMDDASRPTATVRGRRSGTCSSAPAPDDFGFVSTAQIAPGFPLPVSRPRRASSTACS